MTAWGESVNVHVDEHSPLHPLHFNHTAILNTFTSDTPCLPTQEQTTKMPENSKFSCYMVRTCHPTTPLTASNLILRLHTIRPPLPSKNPTHQKAPRKISCSFTHSHRCPHQRSRPHLSHRPLRSHLCRSQRSRSQRRRKRMVETARTR